MAIEPEKFAYGETPTSEAGKNRLPLPAEEWEVRAFLSGQLEAMAGSISKPFFHTIPSTPIHLLTIGAGPDGIVRRPGNDPDMLFSKKRLQIVIFEIIKRYGFDPEYSILQSVSKDKISTEVRQYPSTRIPGLIFERTLQTDEIYGRPLSVEWNAFDHAPITRIRRLS